MDDKPRIEPDEPLNALLDRVERGEEVVISRDGKPIAKLVQSEPVADRSEAIAAMNRIIEMSEGVTLGGLRFKDLIHEGHKY